MESGDPELSDLRSKFWISNPTGGGDNVGYPWEGASIRGQKLKVGLTLTSLVAMVDAIQKAGLESLLNLLIKAKTKHRE